MAWKCYNCDKIFDNEWQVDAHEVAGECLENPYMKQQEKSMATYCGIPLAVLHESYMKQQEKPKMTRQEADNKANRNYYPSNSFGMNLINALEALGLLKFEEEKKENTIHEVIRKARNIHSNDVIGNNKFMQDLYDNGYRIVKLGDPVMIDIGSGIRCLGSLVDRNK